MPQLSVIIPVYNAARFLDDCLSSVCSQTFQDIEILCVDDGSCDDSREILSKWAAGDGRVHVFSQSNQGLSAARNTGLHQATGEYVAFVDADDRIARDMYAEMMEKAMHRHLDVIGCSFLTVPGGHYSLFPLKTEEVLDFKSLIATSDHIESSNDLCFVWRYLFRRTILENNQICFLGKLRMAEDMVFVTEAMAASRRILLLQEAYYFYRTDNSASLMKTTHDPVRLVAIPLSWQAKMDQIRRFRMDDYSPCSSDLARYTLWNLLPMMMEALPVEAGREGVRNILSTEMICKSCKILGFANPFDSWKEYLYYLAVKFRLPAVVSRLYLHK